LTARPLLRYLLLGIAGLGAVFLALAGYIAATFDPNDYKDEVADLVKRSKGRDLRVEGAIRLSFWPDLAADLSGVSLSEHGNAANFLKVERVRASVKVMPLLGGQVVVNGIDVSGVRANVRRDAQGRFNFADLMSPSEEKSEKVAFDIANIHVHDSRIDYADAGGARITVDGIDVQTGAISESSARDVRIAARLADPTQPVQIKAKLAQAGFGEALSGQGVDLQVLVDGAETKLDARATMDRLDQKGQLLQTSPLQATVSGKVAGSSVDLKLATPLRLDLQRNQLSLPELVLGFAAKQQLVDLTGTLKGPAEYALGGKTLRLAKFALDMTASSPKLTGGPVPVKLAGDLTASVAAQNAELRFDGLVDGHAVTGTVGAELTGAQVADAGVADDRLAGTQGARTPALRGDLKAVDVDIARVIARFSPSERLTGTGNLDLRVTTRGTNAADLTQALNGEGRVSLHDGAVKGLDLNSSLREVRASVRKALGKETGTTVKSKRTDFSAMTATFQIRDGVLDNRDLALKSPLLRVAGAGTIDLVKGELDYGVKASVVASREGQGGEERADLLGVTVPVKLFGPLAAPRYSIDFAAMLTPESVQKALSDPKAARDAVKDTVRDVKDQVKGLKNLFGR